MTPAESISLAALERADEQARIDVIRVLRGMDKSQRYRVWKAIGCLLDAESAMPGLLDAYWDNVTK